MNKKDLKNKYKQLKFSMGVFQIKNTINDKILIDISTNIDSKLNRHKTELKFGSHRNKVLQNDWDKYGSESFSFSVLSQLEEIDDEVNYQKELEVLKSMIIEELDVDQKFLY